MVIDAQYVFHEEGMIKQFQDAGFELKPLTWNHLEKLEEPELVEGASNTL